MPDSDENFEDDFDTEELDDLWDDELEAEEFQDLEDPPIEDLDEALDDTGGLADLKAENKKKKKGGSKGLMLLIILAAGGYAAYMFLDPLGSKQQQVPIVQIENTPDQTAATEAAMPENTQTQEIPAQANEQQASAAQELMTPSDQIPQNESVLTPMPDNLSEMDVNLPELTSEEETAENAIEMMESEEKLALVEDEMLSKTEMPFEEENLEEQEIIVENEAVTALEQIELKMKQASSEQDSAVDTLETQTELIPDLSSENSMEADAANSLAEPEDSKISVKPDFEVHEELETDTLKEEPVFSFTPEPDPEEVIEEEIAVMPEPEPEPLVQAEITPEPEPVVQAESEPVPAPMPAPVEEISEEETAESPPEVMPEPEPETSPLPEAKPKVKPEVQEQPAENKPAESVKEAPKKVVKKDWVMRSAQDGKAVIYDKISTEMKSIEVGDTVSGLGKIKAIHKIDGKWVIDGTIKDLNQ